MNRFRRLVKPSVEVTTKHARSGQVAQDEADVEQSSSDDAGVGMTAMPDAEEGASTEAMPVQATENEVTSANSDTSAQIDPASANGETDSPKRSDTAPILGQDEAESPAVEDEDEAAHGDQASPDAPETAATHEVDDAALPGDAMSNDMEAAAIASPETVEAAEEEHIDLDGADTQPQPVLAESELEELPQEAVSAGDINESAEVAEPADSTGNEPEPALADLDGGTGPLLAADMSSTDVPTGVLSAEQLEDQTSPLVPPAEREELTALPVNAVVDGRYIVQNVLHHSQDRNLYRVTTRKQQRCLTCGRVVSAELEACPHCGAALEGQPAADFYLMAESYRPDALMQDPAMMERNLYHPNLVPVIDFFNHKPFGHVRYYAVAEPRQGVRLSQLSLPRPGAQVLNWAMQLTDALDYLHSRGVVGAGAEADDILVQGDRASLASLQNARGNVEDAEELAELQSMDLARLAGTMYEAFTGHPATMSPEGILPMPSSAPDQVGTAFRAAIEPVQGVAPPISAALWRDLLASALEAVVELERPGRPVSFVSAALTDVGRLREQNQDSFGMIEFTQGSVERPLRTGLFMVADGLGGHKGGEIASAIGVQAFCGEIMSRIISSLVAAPGDRTLPGNDAILQGMARAVQAANERIYKARDNRQNDMGTTVVAALIAGGKAYIVNVGDSRIYLYSKPHQSPNHENGNMSPVVKGTSPLAGTTPLKGTNVLDPAAAMAAQVEIAPIDRSEYVLTQVSVDHSLVHRLVELGQLDPEEAKVHPHRNFIYRSLGGPPPVEVDTFVRTMHPGDRLLLCSDGLNSMIEDSDMVDVLASTEDPQLAAQRLIDLANEAGGHDNITAIVVDITGYLPLPEHPTALSNT